MNLRITSTVLELFRNDPDPGIHSAAKWLLRHWNRQADVSTFEAAMASADTRRQGFRWRVGRSGLTFATVDDPVTGRVIEVSDTEIPRDLFLKYFPRHAYKSEASPDPDCPISSIYYVVAASFCNKLTDLDGLAEKQRCYGKASLRSVEPVAGALDLAGYRLLTDIEFRLVCKAGTTTKRYFGNKSKLLPKYAWCASGDGPRSHPVASLKPNDYGLFDTLGNAYELCHYSAAPPNSKLRAIFCGASAALSELAIRFDETRGPTSIDQWDAVEDVGFRVARTVRPAIHHTD